VAHSNVIRHSRSKTPLYLAKKRRDRMGHPAHHKRAATICPTEKRRRSPRRLLLQTRGSREPSQLSGEGEAGAHALVSRALTPLRGALSLRLRSGQALGLFARAGNDAAYHVASHARLRPRRHRLRCCNRLWFPPLRQAQGRLFAKNARPAHPTVFSPAYEKSEA
jgi:hypothetical protein